MKLEKINENILNDIGLKIKLGKEIYAYKTDTNEIIGIVTFFVEDYNLLNFYVFDKYQGNGYGKRMVNEALKLLKERGYQEINVTIDRRNIKAIKIIVSLGGKPLANIENLSRYVILL